MSFRTDLQLAPEQRGVIQNQSAWVGGGGSSSVVTFSGVYTGLAKVTITINSNSIAITIGSGTATIYWSGSDGSAGTLYVGAGYTAGTPLLFYEGVSVAFAAGTVDDLDSMTVDLQAQRALPQDYTFLDAFQGGSSSTADVILAAIGRESRDGVQAFLNGDAGVVRTAIARSPSITVDWMDDTRGDALRYMEETRIPIMVGEDFDSTTRFLWRGGSLVPLIGPPGVFVRATAGSYIDKRSSLFKIAPSGVSRQRAGKCGLATSIDAGACTNLLPRFHAKSGTLGWTASGSATAAFDTGIRPLLDLKDTGWSAAFRAGVLRAYLPTGGGNTLDADDATIPAAVANYVGQVWVKGRGRITVALRFGVGAITRTATTSAAVDLTKDWQRIVVTGASLIAETRVDLLLAASTHSSVCFVGPAQIEAGLVASTIVQTDGATATRNAETLSFPITVPPHEGSLGFWFYWPGDDSASSYSIIETSGVSGSQRFALRYNSSASNLNFFTATAGPLSYNVDLAAETWYHVVLQWSRSANASEITRTLYLNGTIAAVDSSANWQPYFGSGLGIAPDLAGADLRGIRFEEMRLDAEVKLIADWYDRLTDAAWLHVHRDLAGRAFGISSASYARRSTAHPDHYVANLGLQQLRVYDGSEIAAR